MGGIKPELPPCGLVWLAFCGVRFCFFANEFLIPAAINLARSPFILLNTQPSLPCAFTFASKLSSLSKILVASSILLVTSFNFWLKKFWVLFTDGVNDLAESLDVFSINWSIYEFTSSVSTAVLTDAADP